MIYVIVGLMIALVAEVADVPLSVADMIVTGVILGAAVGVASKLTGVKVG